MKPSELANQMQKEKAEKAKIEREGGLREQIRAIADMTGEELVVTSQDGEKFFVAWDEGFEFECNSSFIHLRKWIGGGYKYAPYPIHALNPARFGTASLGNAILVLEKLEAEESSKLKSRLPGIFANMLKK